MKFCLFTFLYFSMGFSLIAQVGVGTITPDPSSILDITAIDKGVLIPRVDLDDVSNSMIDTVNTVGDGMLIYNTNAAVIGGGGIGIYYFNGTIWVQLGATGVASGDADWFIAETTNIPTLINDDIFTHGNVSMGKADAPFPLSVASHSLNRVLDIEMDVPGNDDQHAIDIFSNNTGSGIQYATYSLMTKEGGGAQTGFYQSMEGDTDGTKIGTFTNIIGDGSGNHTGTYNYLLSPGDGSKYGEQTYLEVAGTGPKYGNHISIESNSTGDLYGVYAEVLRPSGNSYAAYFLGNVSVGTTTANSYILPASDGTPGQVMQTDGAGQLSWVTPPAPQPLNGTGISSEAFNKVENTTTEVSELKSRIDILQDLVQLQQKQIDALLSVKKTSN